jgi:hypothetical protein
MAWTSSSSPKVPAKHERHYDHAESGNAVGNAVHGCQPADLKSDDIHDLPRHCCSSIGFLSRAVLSPGQLQPHAIQKIAPGDLSQGVREQGPRKVGHQMPALHGLLKRHHPCPRPEYVSLEIDPHIPPD